MDTSNFSSVRSPRQELQGQRPTPLKVRKDSHKIKKPPVVPQTIGQSQQHHAPPPPPVIIYTVSPKIIHANPNEFMSLVQRLTGPSSTYTSSTTSMIDPPSSSLSAFGSQERCGAVSPAARFASIEKAKSPNGRKTLVLDHAMEMEQGVKDTGAEYHRTGQFPGILSPNPNAIPPIHPNYFAPQSDSNPLSFFFDLSPVLHSNRNGSPNNFAMPSPSFFSPQINIPSPNTLDLLNSLYEF